MGGRVWGDLGSAHAKRLVTMLVAGSVIFIAMLFGLQELLIYGNAPPDPSFFRFYPIMAGLGAVFGFALWWSLEQGGVNPFHDR